MEPGARVRDFFIAPATPRPATRVVPAGPPPFAILLGAARELSAATPALALALARARGEGCAVACTWRADGAPALRLASSRPARRAARRLEADGLDASAGGWVARVTLPGDAAAADAAAARVLQAAHGPVALGLAGPRDDRFERALRQADVVIVVRRPADDPALARLVMAGLEGLPAPVLDCELRPGPLWRLAAAGAAVPAGMRFALAPAVRAAT